MVTYQSRTINHIYRRYIHVHSSEASDNAIFSYFSYCCHVDVTSVRYIRDHPIFPSLLELGLSFLSHFVHEFLWVFFALYNCNHQGNIRGKYVAPTNALHY